MHMNQYAQRFIRDMDKDSRDDLVLHTTWWVVQILYGRGGVSDHSFVSSSVTGCVVSSSEPLIVANRQVLLSWGLQIVDKSLLRREGLRKPSSADDTTAVAW
jgi:hypothetical protein